MFLPFEGGDFGNSIRISGSSMLTLGFAAPGAGGPTVIVFVAAATGLVVVALLIGYLPTIYAAFNRREAMVTMLESRAGMPAWGPELLTREAFIGGVDTLPALYRRLGALGLGSRRVAYDSSGAGVVPVSAPVEVVDHEHAGGDGFGGAISIAVA
jgi:hypothetical protein